MDGQVGPIASSKRDTSSIRWTIRRAAGRRMSRCQAPTAKRRWSGTSTSAPRSSSSGSGPTAASAKNPTQWPGTGKIGDPVFDTFMKSQVQFAGATGTLTTAAGVALLDMIGTQVILFTHSQGGGFGFEMTEQRPQQVPLMVALEPGGPQFGGVDTA